MFTVTAWFLNAWYDQPPPAPHGLRRYAVYSTGVCGKGKLFRALATLQMLKERDGGFGFMIPVETGCC